MRYFGRGGCGGFWFHGFPERVAEMKNLPVWAFHGAKDDVIPLSASEELVTTLRQGGGVDIYTQTLVAA